MVGRHRNPLTVVLLSIVTLGIYLLYWIYITFAEVRAHRGKGTSGIVGLLLALDSRLDLSPALARRRHVRRGGQDEADHGL